MNPQPTLAARSLATFEYIKYKRMAISQEEYEAPPSDDEYSVRSEDLFKTGVDEIVQEGQLYRWWPGQSANFKEVYIQISQRAFRYFLNRYNSQYGKPLSAFRRRIVHSARPYKINKDSYLKPGAQVTNKGKE